jgi:hypothetical protein
MARSIRTSSTSFATPNRRKRTGRFDLLAYGMAHEVPQLDEKCYLEVYQPRNTRPALKKKVKV